MAWSACWSTTATWRPTEVELPEHETYSIDQYAAVRVMEDGVPGIVVSLDDHDADPPELDLLRELGKHSSIQVPIMLEGKMWGELYATRAAGMPGFVASDIELAQAVAAQVAAGHRRRRARTPGVRARRCSTPSPAWPTAPRSRSGWRPPSPAHLRDGRIVSVVICDVNGLKRVNDERGHIAGDRLLIRVGELLGDRRLPAARRAGREAGR